MGEAEEEMLTRAGKLLAKGTGRFGEVVENSPASLIRVHRVDDGIARVKVVDAVGMVAIPGLQLTVGPKIPHHHFLEIVSRSGRLPRLSEFSGTLRESESFATLVCQWFVVALERILAEGLSRDYREVREQTSTVRGRLDALATARLFYAGRLAFAAEFEEFDFDTPLNRLLLAASKAIAAAALLPTDLRQRAIRASKQMDSVGRLRASDPLARVDRTTAHYADGVLLAKQVIAATGRAPLGGERKSWTFLFRSAIPVEEGLRAILRDACHPIGVRKAAFGLGGSSMTVNPDLVFGSDSAVGDVKYKLGTGEWDRGDLYEIVAFAAAAGVADALIVDFRAGETAPPPPVSFGEIRVASASWPTDPGISVDRARKALVDAVRQWLAESGAARKNTARIRIWALLGSNQ